MVTVAFNQHVTATEPEIRLFLLGGFRASRHEQPIPRSAWLKRAAARSIVKILALEPGHRLHREQILDMLWSDTDLESAMNSFAKALHAARHALDAGKQGASRLELVDNLLTLHVEGLWIDVEKFEDIAVQAIVSEDVSGLEAAVALYSGELLPEDRYADWASARRVALAERHAQVLTTLATVLERRGAYGPAVERLREVLQEDPLREDVHRHLMHLFAVTGARHEALQQYYICREVLATQLGVEPAPDTTALYRRIADDSGDQVAGAGRQDQGLDEPILPPAIPRYPSIPLAGREQILALSIDALEGSSTGAGAVVLVSGELGVGKTRLVAEVAREAHRRGAVVLWGTSHEQEGPIPYGAFIEAVEGYLIGRSEREREDVAARYPELGRVLPTLAHISQPTTSSGDPQSQRVHLFASMTRLLGDLATTRPLLLVLDDLHAADSDTLQLLYHLARFAPERRWLVLGTYRDEDVLAGGPFQQLVATAARAGLCRRVGLGRLPLEACTRVIENLLANGDIPKEVLDRLASLSLGNPLFLQELVLAMREQGHLTLEGGQWRIADAIAEPIPERVHDLVAARVDRLDEDVRRILALASAAGMESSFDEIAAARARMSPLPSKESIVDALDLGVRAGILEERGTGYAFRHPLFRAVIYQRLSQPRRAMFHLAFGEVLESTRPDDVELLAYHFQKSTDPDRASGYLERAGDRARSIYANEAAAAHYKGLVEALDRVGLDVESAGARENLGMVLITMARYDEALTILEQAIAPLQAAGDADRLGRVMGQIGVAHYFRGTPEAGMERVVPLVHRLQHSPPSHGLAALYGALAYLTFSCGQFDETLTAAEKAAHISRDIGNDRVLAMAQLSHALALTQLGRWWEAREILQGVRSLAEATGNLDLLAASFNNLAATFMVEGDYEISEMYLERGMEVTKRLGDPARLAFMTYRQGVNAYAASDQRRASELFVRAVALFQEVPRSWASPYPLLGLARLAFLAGDAKGERQYLKEAVRTANDIGTPAALLGPFSLLAEHELLGGQSESSRKRLLELAEQFKGASDEETLMRILTWTILQMSGEPKG